MSEKNKVTFLPIKNKTNSALFLKKVARNITLSSSTPIVKCQHDLNIPASTLQHPLNTPATCANGAEVGILANREASFSS
ncbi:hypothetical protein [Paenibacillus tyrfis]|uniref:hypothetical protein n=1 Tax=Paenibacillus tyrfis TaxID=1501230 RepID=UPI00126994CF|nr:hypothetical protein [Paenibacillus tyrfis]